MKEIELFKSTPLPLRHSKYGHYAEMTVNCRNINKSLVLQGDFLMKQFNYKDYYIIFSSDGTSLDTVLTIYCLSQDCGMLDAVELKSWDGVTCCARNIEIISENQIEFNFFGGHDKWRLTVLDKPSYFALLRTNCPFFTRPLRRWIHPAYLILNRISRS